MFDWAGYIDIAEQLYLSASSHVSSPPTNDDEAKFRAACSRAYYAAHKIAQDYANGHSKTPIYGNGGHNQVLGFFVGKPIHRDLQRLLTDRAISDYKANQIIHASTARDNIARAKQILAWLAAHP